MCSKRGILSVIQRGFRTSPCIRATYPTEFEMFMKCRKDAYLETCIIDDSMINPCWESPKVVIIGAGVAGLSAASRLASSGFPKITVCEAADRPGGRIHSCWFGPTVTEIGATYLHGTTIANSVFPMAASEGLVKEPYMKETDDGLMMTSQSEIISTFVSSASDACFKTILKQAADLFVMCGPGVQCGSLHDFISRRIDQEIKLFPFQYRAQAAKVMVSKMVDLESKIGAELYKVAACQFGTLVDIPGGNISVPSGMVGILAPMLKDMPSCSSIKYCKPVKKINWKTSDPDCPRCRVYCVDGDVLEADYVIVTVSLGVLKSNSIKFDPPLPEGKQKAINEMGFGHVNHAYLEYEKPFWVWSEGSVRLGWNFEESEHREGWVKGISAIKELPTSQQILQVTVGGDAALILESLSDVQIAQDITSVHRKFLNNPELPYPVNVQRSKWSSSPFFAGAKSYFGLNTTLQTQCEIGKPVPDGCCNELPVLCFAGEATAIGAHGTVHGARNSGLREADRIISMTKKLKGRPKLTQENSEDKAVANI
ncbi:peroxisomal N(1)-acetyl-spermine/spermidine oxidase-like [Cimex lectularius]|uniref:Amine oxidase domain-containing protein n=1 Tax=Cimex lectularius TaxID=79782 RepID=A0A8I6S6C2_CIMLE|nr:peroxisomal N(1)-acetyl-spermine/spermidine oxidase-like [Cimex lectularius]